MTHLRCEALRLVSKAWTWEKCVFFLLFLASFAGCVFPSKHHFVVVVFFLGVFGPSFLKWGIGGLSWHNDSNRTQWWNKQPEPTHHRDSGGNDRPNAPGKAAAETLYLLRTALPGGNGPKQMHNNIQVPGVSKGCCMEVFKYLRASKKHSFVTPGSGASSSDLRLFLLVELVPVAKAADVCVCVCVCSITIILLSLLLSLIV